RGIPTGVFDQAAADNRRGDGIRVALAVKRLQHHVFISISTKLGLCVGLTQCLRHIKCIIHADGLGDCCIDERFYAVKTHMGQHVLSFFGIWPKVAGNEIHKCQTPLEETNICPGLLKRPHKQSTLLIIWLAPSIHCFSHPKEKPASTLSRTSRRPPALTRSL